MEIVKTLKHFTLNLVIICLCFSCSVQENEQTSNNEKLWYTYPAKYWNSQVLHLGNGYFGVSFYGGAQEEVFTLSEQSMWTGGPVEDDWEEVGVNPNALKTLPKIREAIINNKIEEADKMVINDFLGKDKKFGNFTSIGSLKLSFEEFEEYTNYKRSLDLANSIGAVEYEVNGVKYNREYFCSYPSRILAMKLTASENEALSFNIGMDMIQDSFKIITTGNKFNLFGYVNENNRPFNVSLQVENKGGEVIAEENTLKINKANSVIIYLSIATNYKLDYPKYIGTDPEKITEAALSKATALGYDALKKEHIEDYQSLYSRSSISFAGNSEYEKLPTNERYKLVKSGMSDPGYKELAFNIGKYMIISCSRPGTLPANLQGVWNTFVRAPWSGNYQSNINIQEIYWPCGPANILECQEPLIDWIEDMVEPGREIAKRCYGTKGWVSHSTGNIWGHTAPVSRIRYGMYPVGAAWHCQHVWEQYAFSQDKNYLENKAYPILKEASIFWLENLIEYQGYLISAPTVSAEHGAAVTENGLNPAFYDDKTQKYVYNIPGVMQDIEMIWDLFTNTAKAAEIIGDNEFLEKVNSAKEKLLPLKIGKYGQLQEWSLDIDNPDCHHRHIAHMYAVCPGTQIHPTTTPELAEAAKKSLNMRGDVRFPKQEQVSGGNWSRAHRMCSWVRLMDGNRANKIMTEILTDEGFENLLSFQHIGYHWEHPEFQNEGDTIFCHFQLDATGAVTAAIAEMLLQSHLGEIHLLPALPDELNTGEAKGLLARGGYEVDIKWENGELVKAVIRSKTNKTPQVRLVNDIIDISKDKRIKIINL